MSAQPPIDHQWPEVDEAAPVNAIELRRRAEKVDKIVHWLLTEYIRITEHASDDDWENVAAKAGTRKPSAESRRQVIAKLRSKL